MLVDEDDKEYYEGRYGTGVGFETWFCSWVGWGYVEVGCGWVVVVG